MQSTETVKPTYGVISIALDALAEMLPEGAPVPNANLIRRAAKRGDVRVCVIGSRHILYNLDDVRSLVTGGDQ